MVVEMTDHVSIVHLNDPIGKFINPAVVCDNDDATVGLECAGFQEFQCFVSAYRVEGGRGLVANDQAGFVHKRAGNGHSLLLSARELVGIGFESLSQADSLKDGACPLFRFGPGFPLQDEGDRDIFHRCECGDEIELLENKADILAAEAGYLTVTHCSEVLVKDGDLAFLELQRATDHAQERCFSAARRTDDHENLAKSCLQAGTLERKNAGVAAGEALHDILDTDCNFVAHRKTTAGSRRMTFVRPMRAEKEQMKMITHATNAGTCQGMKKGGASLASTVFPNQAANPTPMP